MLVARFDEYTSADFCAYLPKPIKNFFRVEKHHSRGRRLPAERQFDAISLRQERGGEVTYPSRSSRRRSIRSSRPAISSSLSSESDSTKYAATDAPIVATIPIPESIKATPISRPVAVTGAMSPYPTVVVVTTAHQTPDQNPPTASGSATKNSPPPEAIIRTVMPATYRTPDRPSIVRSAGAARLKTAASLTRRVSRTSRVAAMKCGRSGKLVTTMAASRTCRRPNRVVADRTARSIAKIVQTAQSAATIQGDTTLWACRTINGIVARAARMTAGGHYRRCVNVIRRRPSISIRL